jgi:acetolactate synthase I/III small subunit
MSMRTLKPEEAAMLTDRYTVLELTVNNHPGVTAQVSGLCARRAFHLEGLLYMPGGRGNGGRIWLRVPADQRLTQVMKQLQRLEDVLDIRRHDASDELAGAVTAFFQT